MYHSGIEPPQGVWWKPVRGAEKVWVIIAFVWCLVLFAMMPLWHLRGGQNPSGIRHRVDPLAFQARTAEFIEEYRVGEEKGIPVVAPPPGSHVDLQASMWQWIPILRLEKGAEYTLHLSSTDLNHGFSLFPLNINFQVVPGYDYGLRVTPNEAGKFEIICNEFCGVGHHLMVGRIEVVDGEAAALDSAPGEGTAVARLAESEGGGR
jgi:cytochrome c oxidase subunit 2